MNGFVIVCAMVIGVIVIACMVNRFLPPDYHNQIEEKYKGE